MRRCEPKAVRADEGSTCNASGVKDTLSLSSNCTSSKYTSPSSPSMALIKHALVLTAQRRHRTANQGDATPRRCRAVPWALLPSTSTTCIVTLLRGRRLYLDSYAEGLARGTAKHIYIGSHTYIKIMKEMGSTSKRMLSKTYYRSIVSSMHSARILNLRSLS